jgi:hypothetical protein
MMNIQLSVFLGIKRMLSVVGELIAKQRIGK